MALPRLPATPRRHNGKLPLTLPFGIDIVGEGPELGRDEHIKDADPEEKGNAHPNADAPQNVEDHQMGDEEKRYLGDQAAPVDPGREGSVGRDDHE